MKKSIIIIIILSSLVAAGVLNLKQQMKMGRDQKHGFKRLYFVKVPLQVKKMSFSGRWHTIAGLRDGEIYLAGGTPGLFLVINSDFTKSIHFDIGIPKAFVDSIGPAFFSSVEETHIYIYAPNVPAIFCWELNSKRLSFVKLPFGSFTQAVPISLNLFFLRKYDKSTEDQSLFQLNLANKELKVEKRKLMPAFHDGGITTDGQLHWDPFVHRLLYNYFYSNGWFSIDSNFLDFRPFHSIDTFNHFQVKVVRQGKYFTTWGDPIPINAYSAVDHGLIFLESTVRADNEISDDFDKASTIDSYDDLTGRYKGSFRVPLCDGGHMHRFIVSQGFLYALYSSTLIVYELSLN